LSLRYYDVVSLCCDLFGPENVIVLPFEGLYSGRERELTLLAQILSDTTENVRSKLCSKDMKARNVRGDDSGLYKVRRRSWLLSSSEKIYHFTQWLTGKRFGQLMIDPRFVRRLRRKMASSYEFRLNEDHYTRIINMYLKQNKKLDTLCGLELVEFGYYE